MSVNATIKQPAVKSAEEKAKLSALEKQLISGNTGIEKHIPDGELLHLLRYFEYHRAIEVPQLVKQGLDSYDVIIDRSREGMNSCLKWLFEKVGSNQTFSDTVESTIPHIHSLLHLREQAWSFCFARDAMNIVWQEFYDFSFESDSVISIEHPDELSKRLEVGEWIKHKFDKTRSKPPFKEWPRLLRTCDVRGTKSGRLQYNLNGAMFKQYRGYVKGLYKSHEELDGDWDFGGYVVNDLRKVWNALISFAYFHASLHDYWARRSSDPAAAYPINSCVPIDTEQNWASRLARWSGVDKNIVELILKDIIYQPELHFWADKKPDASFQPFFRLADSTLALSCFLVTATFFERTMWDLLSIVRPELYGDLARQKEKPWLDALAEKYRGKKLLAFPNVKFKYDEEGDVDLLLLDPETYFGLACELKWLAGPDRINETEMKAIRKGFTQAEKSDRWITKRPEQVAEKIKMDKAEFQKYRIKPIVLTRSSALNGIARHSSIPLVLEKILYWFMEEKHCDLETAYNAIADYSYLPRVNTDFRERRFSITHGGITFRLSEFKMTRNWSPTADIQISPGGN